MAWIASVWSSSLFWEWAEYTGEAIVIIGVIFEGLTDFEIILKGDARKVLRGHLERLSLLVLIIGLVIGLTALFRTNQLFSETIGSLDKQARDANNRAAIALDKSTSATLLAAKAASGAQTALDREVALRQNAEREATARTGVEKEAAILRKEAEDERASRMKIESDLAWRRLSAEDRSALAKVVAAFPKEPVGIIYSAGDVESYGFATDIVSAIKNDWNVFAEPLSVSKQRAGPVPLGTNPPLDRGVFIANTPDIVSRNAGKALSDALNALGFDSSLIPLPYAFSQMLNRGPPTVFVEIDPRPDGPQGEAKMAAAKVKNKP
jgi:hypothetical protein